MSSPANDICESPFNLRYAPHHHLRAQSLRFRLPVQKRPGNRFFVSQIFASIANSHYFACCYWFAEYLLLADRLPVRLWRHIFDDVTPFTLTVRQRQWRGINRASFLYTHVKFRDHRAEWNKMTAPYFWVQTLWTPGRSNRPVAINWAS